MFVTGPSHEIGEFVFGRGEEDVQLVHGAGGTDIKGDGPIFRLQALGRSIEENDGFGFKALEFANRGAANGTRLNGV
jgi:hypothetical protein